MAQPGIDEDESGTRIFERFLHQFSKVENFIGTLSFDKEWSWLHSHARFEAGRGGSRVARPGWHGAFGHGSLLEVASRAAAPAAERSCVR